MTLHMTQTNRSNHTMQLLCLLGLLLLPLTGMAQIGDFFVPPASDISLQVMQNIFGKGSDPLDGKILRPLLMVFSSGIVIFMGAIFAFNLTKFVLHTAQEGEMMIGKGKQMGLVVLRSVFGLAMIIPSYAAGGYRGLSLSFIFVSWLITNGIGLADRGVNAVVDYLVSGGTILQMTQESKDTTSRQALVKPALDILAAQVCVLQLRNFAQAKQESDKQTAQEIAAKSGESSPPPTTPPRPFQNTDVSFDMNTQTGIIVFGTRKRVDGPGGRPQYFGECGTVSYPVDAGNPVKNSTIGAAVLQMITALQPLAASIAQNFPAQRTVLDQRMLSDPVNAAYNYVNLVAPLRAQGADQKTREVYAKLQSIKERGWIVLGAYYPMMGNLNRDKSSLTAFLPSSSSVGTLSQGRADTKTADTWYVFGNVTSAQFNALKDQFSYVTGSQAAVAAVIASLEANPSLQAQLAAGAPVGVAQAGPFQPSVPLANAQSGQDATINAAKALANRLTSTSRGEIGPTFFTNDTGNLIGGVAGNAAQTGGNYIGYGLTTAGNYIGRQLNGLGGELQKGATLGGMLDQGKIDTATGLMSAASIVGGPITIGTLIPIAITFSQIAGRFRTAIDQSQQGDPLLALQGFGFYVLDVMVLLFGILMAVAFVTGAVPASIPTMSLATMFNGSQAIISPIIAMFFAGMAGLGIGFAIYIPMIPFVVWISAILGWVGHSFQAIVGAPLVALRMTTAEGEGLLGGATEGVMMLLGVMLTPFLLVMGFTATLILIKQLLMVVNYLFSIFADAMFSPFVNRASWIILGVPGIIFLYFTLITTVVQSIATKLIGELPGEVMRHLHTAMVGHKAAEQMAGKMEQTTEKMGGTAGEFGGKGAGGSVQKADETRDKKVSDRAAAKEKEKGGDKGDGKT